MGIFQCPDHGRASIAHICPHMRSAMYQGGTVPTMAAYPLEIEQGSAPWVTLHFCSECVRSRDLPSPSRPLSVSEQAVLGDRLNTESVCDRCFVHVIQEAG
jgi:hypothetical protein